MSGELVCDGCAHHVDEAFEAGYRAGLRAAASMAARMGDLLESLYGSCCMQRVSPAPNRP
jgi:hypothetical protein